MEAIGVGANVLAFVVLGIKSAKLAHDTFSAIKDGPALVQNLAANFLQLHWILEHLLQCRAAAADTALHGQARQCCEDLDKLAKTIERLQVPPKEKAAGRFWKRLKTAISESDLKRLDKWVAGQASLLNLRLVVLSSNEIYAMRDGNERTQQQIHAIGASVKTQLESQTASFLGAARGITINHNDGRSALEAGLSSVQQKIEAAHSISVENTQSMFQLLKEIKDGNPPESNGADMANAVDGTLETIDRLCSLIDEKRDAVDAYAEDDDQAQSAIENLEKLVQSLREQELPVSDPESFSNDLSRFSKWFGSGALSINSGTDQDGDETTAEERCHTDWTMTVAYLPGQGQNRHMVLASLARQGLSANRMTCISRLQVNRLLPAESPVFQLVKQGNLQGFKEMLQQGKASLQDHDEYGASLLFYSAEQPELCKFLIDSGLDIDHVATDYGCNEWEDDETQMV
ncbi:hypothetical protein N0V84_000348 [Fusarium piperis]|uniref:Fungal N-terminal domain-containing protein n=1 Tax=Fusarium piperis TaxID=1435070 RepID=A0A9W8WN53_9HYPO|nr:hypothetical protein N0V84_000348 [Fusarium piperis]